MKYLLTDIEIEKIKAEAEIKGYKEGIEEAMRILRK